MNKTPVDGIIEIVRSRNPENIKVVWDYFNRNIYDPMGNKKPYPELGAIVSRGRIIKKHHNCAAIVNPKDPFGTWTYAFLNRDAKFAVEDVVIIHFAAFKVINISFANMKSRKILFFAWLNKVEGKIIIDGDGRSFSMP